ncbi:MAG: phenylalanine--tRNA ligase subunit alpha [Candidatus Aenigmatarchaeota archaeon]
MKRYILTKEGMTYAKIGLPETRLLKLKFPISIKDAKKTVQELNIAIQWAKKKGWIKISDGKIILLKKPEKFEEEEALKKIAQGKYSDISKNFIEILLKRKLIEPERARVEKIKELTSEHLKTGAWKEAEIVPYNVKVPGEQIFPGKHHILTAWIKKIREIFFDLGFEEKEGPLIENAFWNFDALFVPQDHPARELAATFYMSNPKELGLPDKRLIDEVRRTHENGGATGSVGWQYKWDQRLASQAILRTHTTSVSARALSEIEPPAKIFSIGRVFRNETIDYKHLPEFTQIEGIVVDENVSFRDLLGYLKEFYVRLGFKKIRFRPAYFPYTEMSVEPEVYFEERGEWLELGGAGIFRPEVTRPLGVDCPVLAWGLGLERPIMLRLGIKDIRTFYYQNDLKFLREVKLWL